MLHGWLRIRRRLRAAFLAVMLLLTAVLSWLGWRLLEQDRQLAAQRQLDQRETAADLTVAAFERRLSAMERDLEVILSRGAPENTPPSDEAVFVRFTAGAIDTWPRASLLFHPDVAPGPNVESTFGAVDVLEFQRRDYEGALRALAPLTASADRHIVAASLVRQARIEVKRGLTDRALKTYEQLAPLDDARVGTLPAPLAAALGRLKTLEGRGDRRAIADAARALASQLDAARQPIAEATYLFLLDELRAAAPDTPTQAASRRVLAEAVAWLQPRVQAASGTGAGGRAVAPLPSGSAVLVWRTTPGATAGFIASLDHVSHRWIDEVTPHLDARGVGLSMAAPDGTRLIGAVSSETRVATRLATTTGLPWTIQTFNRGDADTAAGARGRLLAAGMAVLLLLILCGAWFIGHTVARELEVAERQSDFVSAVSHEFRTPLTTLCQLSELLLRDRVAGDEDRRAYYDLLHRESHRLRRLVESLLDFGRLEAKRMPFHFETLDAGLVMRQAADEFVRGPQARAHRVDIEAEDGTTLVRADRDTLRTVFWNLLENAAKYSPDAHAVFVGVSNRGADVEIRVRDEGVGIPAGERRRIFDTFVRGASARESGVRGTGLGLAMARRIVVAHGGTIDVESTPGRGSIFIVRLPRAEA